MARLDSYRIGIPRELSEIRTQPWLSEESLTCDPYYHILKNGAISCVLRAIFNHFHGKKSSQKIINKHEFFH